MEALNLPGDKKAVWIRQKWTPGKAVLIPEMCPCALEQRLCVASGITRSVGDTGTKNLIQLRAEELG